MRTCCRFLALVLLAAGPSAIRAADGPGNIICVVTTDAAVPPGADRAMLRADPMKLPDGAEWVLVDLFGPLPDEEGEDLLAARPEWREADEQANQSLEGTPCYAVPEVRAARLAQIRALVHAGARGVCLSALPRADWPAGINVARRFGFNAPVIQAFERQHGRSPVGSAENSVDRALFVAAKADLMRELLVQVRETCPGVQVALACAAPDLLPHTATGASLDVFSWVAGGLLDEVMVLAGPTAGMLSLKLLTDRELKTWVWCRASTPESFISAASSAANTAGADGVVIDVPWDSGSAIAEFNRVLAQREQQLAAQEQLRKDIESGKLVPVAATELKGELNQAGIHGVAQSFAVPEATTVHAIGIVAALRGQNAKANPPVVMSIRTDADGKPGSDILAEATLTADAFEADPGYRWGYARLNKPLALQPGQVYWLYGPSTHTDAGYYVWRVLPDQYPGGQAWSSQYDYARFDWVFAIFAEEE